MKPVLKAVSVLFIAIAAFLVYAILAALTSEEGARMGVVVAYAAVAAALGFAAAKLWNWRGGGTPQSA